MSVANNKLPKAPFVLEIISPQKDKKSWVLDKSSYSLGSSSKCDIRLLDINIPKQHCIITVLEDHVLIQILDGVQEGIKIGDKSYQKVKLQEEGKVHIGNFELHLLQKAKIKPPKSLLKKVTNELDYNFQNENQFTISTQLPVEISEDNARFEDYIDTNEEKPFPIFPSNKIDRRRVVEVIFMSFGNIVGFESIPLHDMYLNHLYQHLPYDMLRLFPEDRDWITCTKGKLSYSVPNGWKLLSDLNNSNVYHITKGSNQIILRVSQGLAPLTAWNFWRDRDEFLGVFKKLTVLLLPILLITLVKYPKDPPKIEIENSVVLYKVKPPEPVVVATPEPTPVPTPEATKVAEIKPTPKPTQPPREKPQPKPKPKEVVKKLPPQPKVAKVPPQINKTPPKRLVVQQGPVKVGGTGPKNPNAARDQAAKAKAQAIAQTKAKVSNALGFLAKSNGLVKVPSTAVSSSNRFLGGRGLAGAKDATGKNMLADIGANSTGSANGPISTTGSRSIASGPVVSDGEINGSGKSMNYVQGKVSVSGLHAAGGSGSFGPVGGQMAVSGNIDQDAVRRAIEKYMSKIRYCYEKALLSKPSISGGVRMEWKIAPGGRASGVRVVQSALNDATLHGCISNVITTIPFPSPKGGVATVAYPFNFTPFQ